MIYCCLCLWLLDHTSWPVDFRLSRHTALGAGVFLLFREAKLCDWLRLSFVRVRAFRYACASGGSPVVETMGPLIPHPTYASVKGPLTLRQSPDLGFSFGTSLSSLFTLSGPFWTRTNIIRKLDSAALGRKGTGFLHVDVACLPLLG